jgi:hypothetical protein
MKRIGKRIGFACVGLALSLTSIVGCTSEANKASLNTSTAADNFEIPRKITYFNLMSNEVIWEKTGYCSLGNADGNGQRSITCKEENKEGKEVYTKDMFSTGQLVSYTVEQLEPAAVSGARTEIIFRPNTLIPDVTIDNSTKVTTPNLESLQGLPTGE